VNETIDIVFRGVRAVAFFAMLFDAHADIVCKSDVESARTAGEDVNVKVVFVLLHFGNGNWTLGGRKADSSASLRNDKQKSQRQNNDAGSGDDAVVAEAGEEVEEAVVGGLVVEEA